MFAHSFDIEQRHHLISYPVYLGAVLVAEQIRHQLQQVAQVGLIQHLLTLQQLEHVHYEPTRLLRRDLLQKHLDVVLVQRYKQLTSQVRVTTFYFTLLWWQYNTPLLKRFRPDDAIHEIQLQLPLMNEST